MGAVFLARDTRLGRRVAMKFLTHDNAALATRFLAEARVTARCKHENIVDIYEVDETDGHSYMVLEYIQGQTLRAWLQDRWRGDGRVSCTEAAAIAVPIVRALVHAHERGLVHRDLKPENVMLTEDGTIKVLDFGIAKVLDGLEPAEGLELRFPGHLIVTGPNTRTGALLGTRPYMSPEQWRGTGIDARSDIWAVGIMLWELATGRHPLAPATRERLESVLDLHEPMPSLAADLDGRDGLDALAEIADRCLIKPLDQRMATSRALLAALQSLAVSLASASGEPAREQDNPYLGLAAFQRADADRFFGRERDTHLILERLRHHRMVTVAGASGAGKSSLVRAGVLPALERSGQAWESFIVRPGRHPLAALADILARLERAPGEGTTAPRSPLDAADRERLTASLRTQPGYPATVLRSQSRSRRCRILLFVDQFEELYTLGADRATRTAFAACLEAVADDAASPLRVLISVRADFLDRVAEDRAFTNELTRSLLLLSPLSRADLHAALTRPLATAGDYAFESEAVIAAMLDSLDATRSPLPLLQFTAAQLWRARDVEKRIITDASYQALGGVEGALARHADAVLTGLSRSEQQLARAVLTSLVSDERTRAIVSVAELGAGVGPELAPDLTRVLDHLADSRLVLMESDRDAGATVELTHESLIERWATLRRWLDEDQDAAEFRGRLRTAARQWDRQGRSDDLLWRGRAADEARRWRADADTALPGLGGRDRAYLEAVVKLAVRSARRRRLLLMTTMALLVGIAVVVSVLAVQAQRSAAAERTSAARARSSAAAERASADRARRSAVHARNATRMAAANENRADPTLVLALVRELEPTVELPPGWRELARWATRQRIAPVILSHTDNITSVAFSPSGRHLALASIDRRALVWNADGSGTPVSFEGHGDTVRSVAFSPDGTRLATGSADGTAWIWSADGHGEPVRLAVGERDVFSVAFGPAGERLATGSGGGLAHVWNADGSGEPVRLEGHRRSVWAVAFSPDGLHVATGSQDGTARVWKADGSGAPVLFEEHRDVVRSVAFSPDGGRVVTGSRDRTARVWKADGSGELVRLEGHLGTVHAAAFSPDGQRIATASDDGIARVWRADGTGRPMHFEGHQDGAVALAFGPESRRVATASRDRTVRVWNVVGNDAMVRLEGHERDILSASFSPDGERVVTTSGDKTARVWKADGSDDPVVLAGHASAVLFGAFSPDGGRLVTTVSRGVARVWNLDGNGEPIRLEGHRGLIRCAAFSPDGTRVVTASHDRTARVWNADGSGEPVVLAGHRGAVWSAAFSPDGGRVATASSDQTARVWDADGRGDPVILAGHQEYVMSAAFGPEGRRVVTASLDKTARVWNADGSGEPVLLEGHQDDLMSAAFSPDGQHVATVSQDRTVRIWNLDQVADGRPSHAMLQMPYLEATTVAFSPDGTHIVTAGHLKRDPRTSTAIHWATVLSTFERLESPDDPELWRATRYCPPVEFRHAKLGMSLEAAREQYARCQSRVNGIRVDASEPTTP